MPTKSPTSILIGGGSGWPLFYNNQKNPFAIDSGMDITIPKLFYDLIFNQTENQLNRNDKLRYIRESNMH
jgi:hypothetical protein